MPTVVCVHSFIIYIMKLVQALFGCLESKSSHESLYTNFFKSCPNHPTFFYPNGPYQPSYATSHPAQAVMDLHLTVK
jgi:hypothetical protein